ncbi:NCS1 family nucleobase:cation symporter-1 [Coniosporium apollinis CBS 100218]|uniref:NCS1 family nucleobase:cation symporter-1 n=1 Tax=Coniosporium apollinis (strain CBS 100218) TaxID=1168221 RepID=R7Z5P2_CONA1|nr:NCS1 family nucleobase:cation symporter-1 [Coniosporium apollinis CBS 100218]EON69482.1 NCS1 family nucleobase:cation symporter-1 [Coniosporium apollinis CBS 100218]
MEKVKSSKLAHWTDKLAVSSEPGLSNTQLLLTNHDLKPVEPERRQWGPWNFVGFWVADSFNINTWMIASSSLVVGLSWWQAWICVWVGYAIAACFICMTGRIGAQYHISFPVVARSSFGIWGALWPVFNRAAMACIWYGVQAWIGGTCVGLMIRSIWLSWANVPDGMHSSDPELFNTRTFVGFFLFWVGSLPFIYPPVHKIRHLFTVKAYVVPTAGIAFFIWAIVRAKGIGPIVHQPNTIHGSELAWEMVKGIMSSIANFATLIVNDPDFSRFAKKPKDALWSQLFTIPIGFALTSFIGIIVSSSSVVIFGTAIWNPLDLLEQFLNEPGVSGGARFGVFIISAAFVLAQLGTNIAANSVSAGTDLTALLPRYINIRRGGYICALIGLVMCPWNLFKSSNQFTTYLSAYSVFLSSIAGVIICDYYLVRKGYLEIKELYSGRKTDAYYFTFGFHLRGYISYILGIVINVVGFVGAIGVDVPIGATYIYNVNFFAGFIVASGSYYLLCRFFPVPACSDTWLEVGDEIRNVSVVYDNTSDEEHNAGAKAAEAASMSRAF